MGPNPLPAGGERELPALFPYSFAPRPWEERNIGAFISPHPPMAEAMGPNPLPAGGEREISALPPYSLSPCPWGEGWGPANAVRREGEGLFQRGTNGVQHRRKLTRDLFIAETDDTMAMGGKEGAAIHILHLRFDCIVRWPVNLNDKSLRTATEVGDEGADGFLPGELVAIKLTVAQVGPENILRCRSCAAKSAGAGSGFFVWSAHGLPLTLPWLTPWAPPLNPQAERGSSPWRRQALRCSARGRCWRRGSGPR